MKVLFIEIFMNLMMYVIDLSEVIVLVKQYDLFIIVDNIFMFFYYQCFLEFGVDIVIYSVSKYIGGYNDVVVGFVVV